MTWEERLATSGAVIGDCDPTDVKALASSCAVVGLYDDGRHVYGAWQYNVNRLYEPGLWQHPEELALLMVTCRALGVRTVLEVGTFHGGTAALLAAYLKAHVHPDATVTSCDLNRYVTEPVGYEYHPHATSISFDGGNFDLVLIDGNHTYDGARQDYRELEGAKFVAFHDIKDRAVAELPCGGVPRLWGELKRDRVTMELLRSDGEPWMGWGLVLR